jgi:pimeloyl-ACP methyl ester carboxylesterase
MLSSLISTLYSVSLFLGGTILLIALVLFLFQDKMIYQPSPPGVSPFPENNPEHYQSPSERGIPFTSEAILTADNVTLSTWLMRRPEPDAPTIVYFHGNAGNIGFRLDIYELLYKQVKANVLAVSYRGYGHSQGQPNEQGLYRDADAVVRFIFEAGVDKAKVFMFGASLGGAVAVYAAQKFREVREM